jgi:hypothetical protein
VNTERSTRNGRQQPDTVLTQAAAESLLVRFTNAINSRQEISAPMAIASMEGWAPVYTPHIAKKIYLSDIHRILRAFVLPYARYDAVCIQSKTYVSNAATLFRNSDVHTNCERRELQDDDVPVNISVINGNLVERSQLNDYAFRGKEHLDLTLLDFCLNTYDTKLTHDQQNMMSRIGTDADEVNRSINVRSRYRDGHPAVATHIRVTYSDGHRHMPSFIGASFASPTNELERELYVASMLIIFARWDSWEQVIAWGIDWEETFRLFMNSAPDQTRRHINNTQLQRECRTAAESKYGVREEEDVAGPNFAANDNSSSVGDPDDHVEDLSPVPFQYSQRVLNYTNGAVQAGMCAGMLPDSRRHTLPPSRPVPDPTLNGDHLVEWLKLMDEVHTPETPEISLRTAVENSRVDGDVVPGYELPNARMHGDSSHSSSTPGGPSIHCPNAGLNEQQQFAYDIIHQHVALVRAGVDPNQLLMKIMGAPGTGKSWVINSISYLFMSLSAQSMLQKAAHQGSAASLIGGHTLCSILQLTVSDKKKDNGPGNLSANRVTMLIARFRDVHYLIIDEISQVFRLCFSSDVLLRFGHYYQGRLCAAC